MARTHLRPSILGALAVLAFGCAAERTLRITSEPEGAVVRLDDETIGTTPFDLSFTHYGIRRVTLYKPGFRTHSEQIELEPPWYEHFPMDFVSEILLPFGWKDERKYHVALVRGSEVMTPPSLRSVIERADALRQAGPEGPRDLPAPRPVDVAPGRPDEESKQP